MLDPRRIAGMARAQPESSRWASSLGIVEIIVILAVALIVIPPENLPDVMRAAGKILRELRLASNMVVRELSGALDQPSEDHPAPPINTMKPSAIASGTNIAQSAAPADPAAPADLKRSADLAVARAPTSASSAPADASSESTAAEPAPGLRQQTRRPDRPT
jgi:Sec-independent protein translocase protein TatA